MSTFQRIGIIGFGGLGVPAFLRLLELPQEIEFNIFDSDVVELSNLHRQVIFSKTDVSKSKIGALKEILKTAPYAKALQNKKVNLFEYKIKEDQLSELSQFDIILDCTDDPNFKFALNDFCKLTNKILIHAGAQGEQGLVVAICPEGACLRCIFGDPNHDCLNEMCNSCRLSGILSAYSGLTGVYQAELAISASNNQLLPKAFKLDSRGVKQISIAPDPNCLICSSHQELDLRHISCPETFVYTKLALLKRTEQTQKILVHFKGLEELRSVEKSIVEEGYCVLSSLIQAELNVYRLLIC